MSDPMHFAACTCFNLRKAARAVTQAHEAALAPIGLKATQFSVLTVLSLIGRPMPLGRAAEIMVMDRTTLTRNLKPLVAAGLVSSTRGEDRRERVLALTDEGRALVERAHPLWHTAQAAIVNHVGAERWTRMLGDLDHVVVAARSANALASDDAPGTG